MAKHGLKAESGDIELLDIDRMECVFRFYGDSHNVPYGQFSQADSPSPVASVASIFGDYTTAAVVSAFSDGYDFDKNFDGINFYSSSGKNERYLNLIRSARVTQQLTSDGKHISPSSYPLVGCSSNINGTSNYEAITAGLPKSVYGLFGKDNLLHLVTFANAHKLVAIEGYITLQINTYRQVFDPNTIESNDVGKTREAVRAAMRRVMEMERAASAISIPCSPNGVSAVQCRTSGVIVALYHKSTSHEIYVCIGVHSAGLRVYRYTNSPDKKRTSVHFNSKCGIKIKGTVSKFDSRQPLMIPIWVSYSGPPFSSMVSPYKMAVVFSNIRNLVIDRIGDQQSINVPAGTVVLPAVIWPDEYRVSYSFVCMIGWESNVHSSYANYGSSSVGMFTDTAYPQRILFDMPALFAERDETRAMDPTMARNKWLYYSNWNNISNMGGYIGVIVYDVQLIGPSDSKRLLLNLKGKIMPKDKNQIIVGISREIVDTETDGSATFRAIRYLSLNVASGFHSVTVDNYARKSTFDRGECAVGSTQFGLTGKPPRGSDIQDWAYRPIMAEAEAGTTDSVGASVLADSLTGADLVHADLPDAVRFKKNQRPPGSSDDLPYKEMEDVGTDYNPCRHLYFRRRGRRGSFVGYAG